MNFCLECGEKHDRRKFCSRACSTRYSQKKNRAAVNARARQKLIDDPVGERRRRAKMARAWRAKNPDKSRALNRKRLGVGFIHDPDDVIFYGYKPPFKKLKEGFGYEGVLLYSKKEQKVQCHECGGFFRALNNGHLMGVHKLTAAGYKEKYGLKPTTALCGEETRKKLLDRPYNPNHMIELKKAQEKRRERIKKGLPDLQSGFKMRLEKKNERGTCPDQLLDRIRDAVRKMGRVPTMEEFVRMNEGKFYGSIRNTYGTWTNAVMKLGLQTHHKEYTRESLIKSMQDFYQTHGRTPKWSDMERGLLPSASAYYARFRTFNAARLAAGVPLVLADGARKSQEWMPTEQERTKMLEQQDFDTFTRAVKRAKPPKPNPTTL